MPKTTIVYFTTVDGDKFTSRDGDILFHNYNYENGCLVLQAEEIPEFIEWLQDEYKKVMGE